MAFNIKLKPQADTGSCAWKQSVDYNTWQTFDPATASPIDVVAALPLTNPLGTTTFATQGCDNTVVRYEQYESSDTTCSNCPSAPADEPVLVVKYAYIPAGSSIDVHGLVTDFDFAAIADNTGDPAADYAAAVPTTGELQIYVASCREVDPCCAAPEITNGRGVVLAADIAPAA